METVEDEKSSLVPHAVKSGVYLGIINAILALLVYVIDPTIMVSWWFGLLILIVNFGLVVYFGIQYRNEGGGFLPFGKAYLHGFVTLIIAGIIGTIFNILLYSVIDPDLPEVLTQAAIDNTAEMMESFGAPADQIDQQLAQIEEDTMARFSLLGTLKGLGWSILIYAVAALVTGLIVKKNEPVENY